jgi:hypothetical protein
MRGNDVRRDGLFSYVRPESRIPSNHPLRLIRNVADEALKALDAQFAALYSKEGRPLIPPEQLLRALLRRCCMDPTDGAVLQCSSGKLI